MTTRDLTQLIDSSERIVFFGGAGTSTESGIPDFRSEQGVGSMDMGERQYSPEEILSRTFFMNHTEQFYEFYKQHMVHRHAAPHDAHRLLVKLEQAGRLAAIITQNIDGLHQLAGSENVLELHGSIHRNYCMTCHAFHSLDDVMNSPQAVPICHECEGIVKPDVVLYQENLNEETITEAVKQISEADVLIVAGTSLTVYPAAGFIRYYQGNKLILINKTVTPMDDLANYVFHDSIGDVLHQLFDEFIT